MSGDLSMLVLLHLAALIVALKVRARRRYFLNAASVARVAYVAGKLAALRGECSWFVACRMMAAEREQWERIEATEARARRRALL